MTAKELLWGLSGLHAHQILEADEFKAPRGRRRAGWAALAACVAVAAAVSWQLLPRTEETAPPTEHPVAAPPTEDGPVPDAGNQTASTDEFADAAEEPSGESLGGVSLGMTQTEVEAVLGHGYEVSETDPVVFPEEYRYRSLAWYYPEFQVRFVDRGSGWFVEEIVARQGSDATLSTGVGLGSTQEELLAAYPEAEIHEEDGGWTAYVEFPDSSLWIIQPPAEESFIRLVAMRREPAGSAP